MPFYPEPTAASVPARNHLAAKAFLRLRTEGGQGQFKDSLAELGVTESTRRAVPQATSDDAHGKSLLRRESSHESARCIPLLWCSRRPCRFYPAPAATAVCLTP